MPPSAPPTFLKTQSRRIALYGLAVVVSAAWAGVWLQAQGRASDAEERLALLLGRTNGAGLSALDPSLQVAALDGAFRRGAYEEVRRAAAGLAAADPRVALLHAAALLELGRDAEALTAAAAVPEAFRTGGLGRELGHVLALKAAGATRLVRDRKGALLAAIGPQGELMPQPGTEDVWPGALATDTARAGEGPAVRLTVDSALSRMALAALGANRGTIVLLDPRTGAVLAAVSDARTRAESGTPAFLQLREPASIQKIITAAATLRAGLDPDAEIRQMTCLGHARYGTGDLWCAYPGGPMKGLAHALATSCNVAFANLGERLGRAAIVGELRRWGFDAPSSELPGAGAVTAPEGDARQLADLSVGLSATAITPVHGALMATVLVNEGRMPRPTLLAAQDGVLGRSPRPVATGPFREVLEAAFLPMLQRAMEAVTAEGGTAEGTAPPDFPVAMKTGTASDGALGYHVNYIGVGPLPDARIAFCVRVTHMGSSRAVNEAARQVLRTLLSSLAAARDS